jgi:predicted RNA binding protein YcfA (HicA-like mRNA interferase family)
MPKLPLISGRKAVRALELADWEVVRQSGSHIIMIKPGSIYTLFHP